MIRPSSPTAEASDLKSLKCGFESHPGHFFVFFLCTCMSIFGETIIAEEFKRNVICSFEPFGSFNNNSYRFYAFTVYSPKNERRIFVSLDKGKNYIEEIVLNEEENEAFFNIVNNPQYIGSKIFFKNPDSRLLYFYWYDDNLSKLNQELDLTGMELRLRDNE